MGLVAVALAVTFISRDAGDERAPADGAARTPATTTTTADRDGQPPGVTLRPPDGSYPTGLPDDPTFFPLGVWLETVVSDDAVADDASAGLNLYVGLAHEDASRLDTIESSGMHLLIQADDWAGDPRADHAAVDGWVVYDEADLMYGPGSDPWSGDPGWNTCVPPQDDGGQCGYTVMREHEARVPDGMLRYANYGLGVLYFESDPEAGRFVNGGFHDVVSADDYAFTRPDVEADERRGATYGAVVERVRSLDDRDGERQPVWGVVEVGHPFPDDSSPTITPDQLRSAVWHSIIAGARGIVYFNHSFGGPCPTFSVIRARCDPEMTPAVTELNQQITELAQVLNSPFADGYVMVDGPVAAMAKRGRDEAWYVFAGAETLGAEGAEATFRVADGTMVEVLYEDRTIEMAGDRFEDTFADGNAVHVYRIT
jgi:hypothetical protein